MTSAFNSSFEVHTPNMKESSFLMQKNKISTVPINGQVGVKGQTDKEHLCNIRTWFLRNGTGGGEQDHTMFVRHLDMRLLGMDSALQICQSLNWKDKLN